MQTFNLFLMRDIWWAPYLAVKNFSLSFSQTGLILKLTLLFGVPGAWLVFRLPVRCTGWVFSGSSILIWNIASCKLNFFAKNAKWISWNLLVLCIWHNQKFCIFNQNVLLDSLLSNWNPVYFTIYKFTCLTVTVSQRIQVMITRIKAVTGPADVVKSMQCHLQIWWSGRDTGRTWLSQCSKIIHDKISQN